MAGSSFGSLVNPRPPASAGGARALAARVLAYLGIPGWGSRVNTRALPVRFPLGLRAYPILGSGAAPLEDHPVPLRVPAPVAPGKPTRD